MPENTESWRPDPDPMEGKVMVLTAERLPLEVRPMESTESSEGQVIMGAHFQERLIARSAMDAEDAALVQRIMERPAQLGLLAQEDEESVQGSLVALFPHGEVKDVIRSRELEDEPWKASLESYDYQEEERSGKPVLVPLGMIVRVPQKRISPDDLQKEAEDMLRTIVTRGAREVVDDLLDDLPEL